ncbi:ABC transporter ATP-binding protein [Halomonadaceae bacterium KBTZ08]
MGGTVSRRLELVGISKTYPGCVANDMVEMTVKPGEIHALVGENGAGKSTLMKIIYGVVKPDAGQIIWNDKETPITGPAHARGLGMGMVFQHFSLFQTLTVTENIALYLSRGEYGSRRRLRERILKVGNDYGLGIDPDRHIHTLSVGEQQRVEIVRCLLQDIQLLILDEPTAVLTPGEVDHLAKVLTQLANKGCSILFISHKLEEVRSLCDRATILRGGRVVGSCIPADTTPEQLSQMMLGDDLRIEKRLGAGSPGEVALSLKAVSVTPNGPFSVPLHNLNLDLHAGEITGLAGVAGNGQDELVDLINGDLAPDSGRLLLCDRELTHAGVLERRRNGLATVPADRLGRGSVHSMSLTENRLLTAYVTDPDARHFLHWRPLMERTQELIRYHQVKASGPGATAGSLSGGNLQKFIVGREIDQSPKVLICFYPTWGVDIGSANRIHQELARLRDQNTAILILTEDLDELFLLCDRVGAICGGELSPLAAGDQVSMETLGQWMAGSFNASQALEGTHAH